MIYYKLFVQCQFGINILVHLSQINSTETFLILIYSSQYDKPVRLQLAVARYSRNVAFYLLTLHNGTLGQYLAV